MNEEKFVDNIISLKQFIDVAAYFVTHRGIKLKKITAVKTIINKDFTEIYFAFRIPEYIIDNDDWFLYGKMCFITIDQLIKFAENNE